MPNVLLIDLASTRACVTVGTQGKIVIRISTNVVLRMGLVNMDSVSIQMDPITANADLAIQVGKIIGNTVHAFILQRV